MTVLDAVLLGILQGLTEFLPISSSGHLILAGKLLGLGEMPLQFELAVHLATLFAVMIALHKTIFGLLKKPLQKKTALLLIATLPTVVIFLLFRNVFEQTFDGKYLILAFSLTAIMILVSSAVQHKHPKPLPSFLDAVLIGIAQGVAGFPGISRSGATICTATLTGTDKRAAAEFSFLLGVPIILGSAIFGLLGASPTAASVPFLPLAFGFLSAFATGLLAVHFLLKLLCTKSLFPFAVYLTALAILLTCDRMFFGIL